ncbi:MAG TPA: 1,4-alpha-glucan branching protein GlgB [Acidimicrobiia bacterium]|jgi:1,4-alpha-glucan branching enzyme
MPSQSRRLIDDTVRYLFAQGTLARGFDHFGGHLDEHGARFAVWAPHALSVSVIGDWNYWSAGADPLEPVDGGIWTGRVSGVVEGNTYKYAIQGPDGVVHERSDPYAFAAEVAPKTASVLWNLDYEWRDQTWMSDRGDRNGISSPMSVYEMHLGSWRRGTDGLSMSYRSIADPLIGYLTDLGFTHVEFMPLTEHPYFPSWGYQTTGYFAPTSRFGTPQDLMYLVDRLHQAGIGVILDWVPSHFATDEHGLGWFDGAALYEHPDWRRGWHPDWNSAVFDYGRPEVMSFLLSSANLWLDRYHIDGIRVDAVASMLYLDYSREPGEWLPNDHGGNEHLEAIEFLRRLNVMVYRTHPGTFTVAEESTAWPGVTRPPDHGGLGFGFKWDMGWMHDTLDYFSRDPLYRSYHQDQLTFRMIYANTESFVLPLSHDEVVHGKGSMARKMPGDEWQRFANLRALYGYMFGMVGKKLLFMGSEIGQWSEWAHDGSLDWAEVTPGSRHEGLQRWVTSLNEAYRALSPLFAADAHAESFRWIDVGDAAHSVVSFERDDLDGNVVIVVGHFSGGDISGYRIGVAGAHPWRVLLNSNAERFGGAGTGTEGVVQPDEVPMHGYSHSIELYLPALSVMYLVPA